MVPMPWSLPQSREPELMDDPAIAEQDHLHALSALARINLVSRTAARLAEGIRRLLEEGPRPARCTVVDVACGGGDVTLDLASRLRRSVSTAAHVVGVDVSSRAIARSQAAAVRRGSEATFDVRDVLADGCPPCDVAVSSLFLHHLDDGDATRLLQSMATAARLGLVVSDLVRSRLGLGLAVVGTTILSSSRIARVDGPLSVRAARTPAEYRRLCDAAGLESATIRRVWPERVVIRWRRSASGRPR
jgi:2-polyprenyl-3-methyl-5-hydroxy-6-metoxy-1,4-benzoquinol methylase